ncbi:MAG: hypothetical protein K2X48_13930 [Chitinophagaceae bacterium]|nr:hypothetical protein [Chitinophagaceae bacterium]
MKQVLLLSLSIIMITSCARRRAMEQEMTNQMLMQRIRQYDIRTIAVLPAQLEITGNIPKKLTTEQFEDLKKRNTQFLNQSLYNDLLQFANARVRYYSQVQFQSIDRTLSLLKEKGITDSAGWSMDPAALSELLGVDAVVVTKITQKHIMSAEAAAGVDVIGGILRQTIPRANLPVNEVRTSDMYVSCSLVKKGFSMWSTRFTNQTDWNYPFQNSIQHVTTAIANQFPL